MSILVQECQLNWFEIIDKLEKTHGTHCNHIKLLSDSIEQLEISTSEKQKLRISQQAFTFAEEDQAVSQREADIYNGEIVTDSESDDPDAVQTAKTPLDPCLRKTILNKRISVKRQAQCLMAKRIEERFLGRQVLKRHDSTVAKYPDIGETIESFVQNNNVGAEAWRRTGVLTFDGNMKKRQKVTYERIRKHLESVYERKFFYGKVVQLCIARNRRHRSSSRYKGVAKVTRRARKGFQLRTILISIGQMLYIVDLISFSLRMEMTY